MSLPICLPGLFLLLDAPAGGMFRPFQNFSLHESGIYRGSYRIETAKLQEDAVPLGVLRLLAEETEALQ